MAPAQPLAEPARKTSVEDGEKYLREAGWSPVGVTETGESLWSDPACGDGISEKVTALRLESQDGGEPVEIKQRRCPPAAWNYPLREAMQVQRERDKAVAVGPRTVVTNK